MAYKRSGVRIPLGPQNEKSTKVVDFPFLRGDSNLLPACRKILETVGF
jgi:hypothetical protein